MSDQMNNNNVQQRAGGGPAVTKGTIKTAKRLLGYVIGTYKIQFIVVLYPDQFHSVHLRIVVAEVSVGRLYHSADRSAES